MASGGYRGLAVLAAFGACAAGIAGFSGSPEVGVAEVVPLAADATSRVAAERLGGCSGAARVTFDPFGQTTILERTGRWVDVTAALPPGAALPADKAAALDWVSRAGARAILGLDGTHVAALLVRHPDGTHFFAGQCASVALTDPLRRELGARYDAVLARLAAGT